MIISRCTRFWRSKALRALMFSPAAAVALGMSRPVVILRRVSSSFGFGLSWASGEDGCPLLGL